LSVRKVGGTSSRLNITDSGERFGASLATLQSCGMDHSDERAPFALPAGEFATTHWSLVLRAGCRASPDARHALSTLCERYWYPLYAYVRRHTRDVNEAQDLTQEFFARLMEKDLLASALPERGRFRAFLLSAVKNFMANEWDRQHAEKRGGGRTLLSLNLETVESRLGLEPYHDLTPERLFEKKWTLMLLELVMEQLQGEALASGKERQFELLKSTLTGEQTGPPYARIANELGISEEAARQAAHRLRKRYRKLLWMEVSQTVGDPAEVEEEIRSLLSTLEK
jgi:RNA polymerase sigma factor (sigma-70 family)